MHIAVVHNPTSGDAHPTRAELLAILARHGHQADYYSSVREWRDEVGEAPELVVVAGGDGTIRKLARRVADATLPLLRGREGRHGSVGCPGRVAPDGGS